MQWRVMVEVTGEMRSFEVMIARASNDQGQEVVFSSMPAEADRHVRQLQHVLCGLGATASTPVTILSDGAEGPRSLGAAASVGPICHVLDWFRLSMRIQRVAQAVQGWTAAVPAATERTTTLADAVSRMRWRLWHDQTERALALIGDTLADLAWPTSTPTWTPPMTGRSERWPCCGARWRPPSSDRPI